MLSSEEETECDLGHGVEGKTMDGLDFSVFIPSIVLCRIENGESSFRVSMGLQFAKCL